MNDKTTWKQLKMDHVLHPAVEGIRLYLYVIIASIRTNYMVTIETRYIADTQHLHTYIRYLS